MTENNANQNQDNELSSQEKISLENQIKILSAWKKFLKS